MSFADPWPPAKATDCIRSLGSDPDLTTVITKHFKERLDDRDLIMSDVLYVIRHGFVYLDAQASTQPGLYKYAIETRTPNSGNRVVRVVLIPDPARRWIKFITVMWAEE